MMEVTNGLAFAAANPVQNPFDTLKILKHEMCT